MDENCLHKLLYFLCILKLIFSFKKYKMLIFLFYLQIKLKRDYSWAFFISLVYGNRRDLWGFSEKRRADRRISNDWSLRRKKVAQETDVSYKKLLESNVKSIL